MRYITNKKIQFFYIAVNINIYMKDSANVFISLAIKFHDIPSALGQNRKFLIDSYKQKSVSSDAAEAYK